MARARSIKPGFFKNEDLAECGPWAMLLFAGLWTLADRAGRLESRPKRIQAEIFPYESRPDGARRRPSIEDLLTLLESHHFLVQYEVNGYKYIAIPTWDKHQNPHCKEAASTIPAPCSNGATQGPAREIPAPAGLTPSSLTPDSLNPHPHSANGAPMPPLQTQSEYPLTKAEIRKHEAAIDDTFVRGLVAKTIQHCLSSKEFPPEKLEKITDKNIARMCKESYATGPPDHRAGLLLSRVPAIAVSWAQERKET